MINELNGLLLRRLFVVVVLYYGRVAGELVVEIFEKFVFVVGVYFYGFVEFLVNC